ncbi:hypothetical protein PUN28_008237 [Cardiocondyla obscurior]|uniref:Uncharacterized protein n=1 Tax=Cardiocondyla obscurior TaxID=286306 RepID=A0AAW2FYW0_9HYME
MLLPLTSTEKSPKIGASRKKTRKSKRKPKTAITPELVPDILPFPPIKAAKTLRVTSIEVFPPQQPLVRILRPPGIKRPVRHTHFQLLDWRPQLANFTPPSLTQPPRIFLAPGDTRVWRYTSTRWNTVARAVSPIPPTPPAKIEREVQAGISTTERAARPRGD